MSKTYDRVEWGFLDAIMSKMGFSRSWIDKIMRCVRSVSYSFLVNQEIVGHILPQRGIRQGDPSSPYLFFICAHGFLSLLTSYESQQLFKGVRLSPACSPISHLFFADDSLIFFPGYLK